MIYLFQNQIANASMPFIMGDYIGLWRFLRKQQERFEVSERVWIQKLEHINECTMFTYQTIEIDHCMQPNPFICEIGLWLICLLSNRCGRLHFLFDLIAHV